MKLNVQLFFVFASAQFALPAELSQPYHIAKGPDGTVWFTSLSSNAIGRLSTTGATAAFSLPPQTLPSDITTGPDGALWFNQVAGVGRLTTAGALTRYLIRGQPTGIRSGPDGALWFPVFAGSVGSLTTSGVTTLYPVANLESSLRPLPVVRTGRFGSPKVRSHGSGGSSGAAF
jgi:streptogramin lyase